MPCELIWLPAAAKDLQRLREFIQQHNPVVANQAGRRILEGANLLTQNPKVGKPVDGLTYFRDLIIPFGNGNYIVRYREDNNSVVIVRIRHSKENTFPE